MRSPRRLSRPTTRERRRPRSEPSDRPVSFRGIWTCRPSARIAMATWRRLRPSNRPKDGLPSRPGRPGRFAQSTRRSVIMQPPRADGVAELLLGPRLAGRRFALADSRTSRDRRSPDGLFPTSVTLTPRARIIASAAPPREPRRSWPERKGPGEPGRPEPSTSESSDQYQRWPAPRVRASDARSAMTPVKRARFAFTLDSFLVSLLNVHR